MKTPVNRIILLILTVTVGLFFSCRKDKLVQTTIPSDVAHYSSLSDFFNKNEVKSQFFTITNPQLADTIVGLRGVILIIPSNAFVDNNNHAPAGSVTIELREVLNVQDMILSNIQTVTTNNDLLQSGGMVKLVATAGVTTLNINQYQGKRIEILLPAKTPIQDMNIFFGKTDSQSVMKWYQADSSIAGITQKDSSSTYFYMMDLNKLGYNWINCDHFYNSSTNTTFKVETAIISGTGDTVDVQAFSVFRRINSIASLHSSSDPKYLESIMVPEGMDATVVGIGVGRNSKKLYFGEKAVTISNGLIVTLPLSAVSEATMMNELNIL